MMPPYLVVPSTTSHKHESILATLDVFARLGMTDLDLNLNHIVERGADAGEVHARIAANGQRVRIVSGGWCDFSDPEPQIQRTFESVERQISLVRRFGADRLRLFFGRLPAEAYRASAAARSRIRTNLQRLADRHTDLLFVLENHDGASSQPEVCREILEAVDRPNVRLTFDPINFEAVGVDSLHAVRRLADLVGHVHLKGLDAAGFCGFGEGRVDLAPVLRELVAAGYRGGFTVEYEGPFDRTVRLYESLQRARSVVADLTRQPVA